MSQNSTKTLVWEEEKKRKRYLVFERADYFHILLDLFP